MSAVIDESDPTCGEYPIPGGFSEAYIRPEIRLEIGPLASWVPSDRHSIKPYAYNVLPNVFENPACEVVAIAAERTFWEKVTILHQEAHRPSLIPPRYSRHYYDLYKLATSPICDAAFAQASLLKDVVEFKQRFYPSAWARYDLAIPGTIKLLPTRQEQLKNLERDYQEMQVMLFGERPEFSAILDALQALEFQINALGRKS